MANLKSSKKAARQTDRRTIRNLAIRRSMKTIIKKVRDNIEKGKLGEAKEAYQKATKQIDKAAKANIIHKNTASRYKSRLAKAINNASKK
jgi:small subunit ribosomal protein S20